MILIKLPQELTVDWFALDNKKADNNKGKVEDLFAFILDDIRGRELNHLLRAKELLSQVQLSSKQRKLDSYRRQHKWLQR